MGTKAREEGEENGDGGMLFSNSERNPRLLYLTILRMECIVR